MARLFGEELDRLTLWARISSGLLSACAKVRDGNMELFVNHCLEHVKADPVRACSAEELPALLKELTGKPAEWRRAFARYVETRIYAVLVHGKEKWNWMKLERKVENGKL